MRLSSRIPRGNQAIVEFETEWNDEDVTRERETDGFVRLDLYKQYREQHQAEIDVALDKKRKWIAKQIAPPVRRSARGPRSILIESESPRVGKRTRSAVRFAANS